MNKVKGYVNLLPTDTKIRMLTGKRFNSYIRINLNVEKETVA